MRLGIIIYTGNNFDIKTKLPILKSCINSIKRQKESDYELIVLCENDGVQKQVIEKETGVTATEFKSLAKGLNSAVRKLNCEKFIISKYNTLYSANSLSELMSFCKGDSLVFNITAKIKGSSKFEPVFQKVSLENQFNICPSVWNVLFDTKTVVSNAIEFTDFSYRDQYIFLMNYFICSKKTVCTDSIYLCIDRALNVRIKPSGEFYSANKKNIFRLIKKLKKSKKGLFLSCFVKDFGVPLLKLSYTEKIKKKRLFYRFYGKRFMNYASGILR